MLVRRAGLIGPQKESWLNYTGIVTLFEPGVMLYLLLPPIMATAQMGPPRSLKNFSVMMFAGN